MRWLQTAPLMAISAVTLEEAHFGLACQPNTRIAPDMLIVATAIEHQLVLATRNVRDFLGCRVQIVNLFYCLQ